MGVIKRQGIKNSIVNYFGVLIGAVSVIFIYPRMDENDLGMIQFTINTATFFAPLAGFGLGLTAVQFYPEFDKNKEERSNFLFVLLSATIVFIGLFLTLIYAIRFPAAEFFGKDKLKFLDSLPYILFFTFINASFNLFSSYSAILNRVVVPSILQNLLLKITQPTLILLFIYGIISFQNIFHGLTLTLAVTLLTMILYIAYLGKLNFKPHFDLLKSSVLKRMWHYSAFNILVSFGGLLALRVDMLLIVPLTQQFGNVAILGFGFFISEAIDIPRKALSAISSPLISKSLKEGNIAHIKEIYQKSALLQVVSGAFLLAGVWSCADALFDLMPKNGDVYRQGKNVILILGLSRLIDMATGANAEIITYSEHYRFNFKSLLVLAVLNITLNFWLVPTSGLGLGITGAALATLISILVVNLWRLVFIYEKFKIQPLQINMLKVVVIASVAWFFAWLTPSVNVPFFNIILKGIVVSIIFIPSVIFFKISPDVDVIFNQIKKRFL